MKDEDVECSFCGKKSTEVRHTIAGPSVYICDECVDLCYGILHDSDPLDELENEDK